VLDERKAGVKQISTPRLVGTPIEPSHFAEIRTLHIDPRVMATLSVDGSIFTEDQTRAFLNRAAEHWALHDFGLWIFHSCSTGDFVGYGGIKHAAVELKDAIELAYAVSSTHWSQGFATEMSEAALKFGFEKLRLERIVAFTLPHNTASRTVMEHCGFIYQRDITHAGLPHVLYHLDSSTYATRARLKRN
jgi:[ribosomal protein S5]-alanine N-acetyltransferase